MEHQGWKHWSPGTSLRHTAVQSKQRCARDTKGEKHRPLQNLLFIHKLFNVCSMCIAGQFTGCFLSTAVFNEVIDATSISCLSDNTIFPYAVHSVKGHLL